MSTPIRGNSATVTPDSSVTVPADGGYGYVAAPAEQSDTNAPAASAGAKGNAGAPSSRYYTYTAEPAYGYSRPHNPGITNTNAAGGGNVPDASAAQQPLTGIMRRTLQDMNRHIRNQPFRVISKNIRMLLEIHCRKEHNHRRFTKNTAHQSNKRQ